MLRFQIYRLGNTNPDYLLRSCTAVTEKPTRLGAQTASCSNSLPLMKLSRSSVASSALMYLRCCQPSMGLDDCSNWKSKQKNTPFQWWCDPHNVFRSKGGCICPVSCASLPEINSNLSINMTGGGHSTELPELIKHIQCVWFYVNHEHRCHFLSRAHVLKAKHAFKMWPSQIIDHRTPPCLAPFKKETGFKPVNLCPPAAPSGQYWVAGHQTGSPEQEKKPASMNTERCVALASHWAGLPDALAGFQTAITGGRVGILMCNCSLTWTNGLPVIKNGPRMPVKGALSKSINKFIPNESWQPLSLEADTRWAGDAQVGGKNEEFNWFPKKGVSPL